MLFKGLAEKDLKEFIHWSNSIKKDYGPGQSIFQEGDRPFYTYMLLDGHVEVDHLSPSGNRAVIAHFTKKNTIFGEVYSLLDIPFDYSARAKDLSSLLLIPGQAILSTPGEPRFHQIAQNLVTLLSTKAYTLNQRLMVQTAPTLGEKILIDLSQRQKDGQVNLPFSREKWAEILAIPRPSLSRELSKLQSQGLIKVQNRKIILLI